VSAKGGSKRPVRPAAKFPFNLGVFDKEVLLYFLSLLGHISLIMVFPADV
jgi:hypothetical protein